MSHFNHPLRQSHLADYTSNPARQPSNASTSSSAYSRDSNPFAPSRSSTLSSAASSGYRYSVAGHKRGISEAAGMGPSAFADGYSSNEGSPIGAYRSVRQSLRSLPQPPSSTPPSNPKKQGSPHSRGKSLDVSRISQFDGEARSSSPLGAGRQFQSSMLRRADSITPTSSSSSRTHGPGPITAPDLKTMGKSATSHLRTISKLTESGAPDELSKIAPTEQVVGMSGRRRLQRTDSLRTGKGNVSLAGGRGLGWGDRNWMDKQRQFLQAYEYLCHIGEAKEWIERVINEPIPPIVELEEALRDGVTLAEVVQALEPGRPVRIFRNPKLQYRHSDNIAIFFRFLADAELPDLFRFELIDLYEKKNIPKVIYCIHALSWLVFRKGYVDFRIGNLVGKLEFEHHELEAMQMGLDKAGISMPSFSGMGANFGAEPEPEPVETEEERIDRELAESERSIANLQCQIRGALKRVQLGNNMQALWDSEDWLVDIQSRLRGDWARQIFEYRLSMKRFATNIQSAARGYLARNREKSREEWWKGREADVVLIQSLVRAKKARAQVAGTRKQLRTETSALQNLQAAIRGALRRKIVSDQVEETRHNERNIESLQAAAKGCLFRVRFRADQKRLKEYQGLFTNLQGCARAMMQRQRQERQLKVLADNNGLWRAFQALCRGFLGRSKHQTSISSLNSHNAAVSAIQSAARGWEVRREVQATKTELKTSVSAISMAQSAIRGMKLRQQLELQAQSLKSLSYPITTLQAASRGCLSRIRNEEFRQELACHAPHITLLQGLSRAMLLRGVVGDVLSQLDNEDDSITELQALARAMLVRRAFAEKQKFFRKNMEKVVKIQSFVRARQQGEAYKSLTSGKNPPVGTIKNFVHLLNDSDFDFDEEIEFERLRKTVVQKVRQNEMAEQYIDQLDIKIALLVKNKITLDEVVKHQRHFGGHVGNLLTNTEISSKDPFDLKAINKNSRKKLEHYQQLFFVLQTQPQYLARYFQRVRTHGTPEKECKRIETLVMGLFGYAQKAREEYYLLKLLGRSIKEEIDSTPSIQDYLRTNFFWSKIMGSYIRSARDRKYMRELLSQLVKENIIENADLDLESDPIQIYRSAINNEELRTGRVSQRQPDIPREEAIRDSETRETFIHHLQDLRDITDQIFERLEELIPRMPFGIRYLAQQMFQSICNRFPDEDQAQMLQIVGNWVWKMYLQPALLQPGDWGVVDRGLAPIQKRNLGEVSKVISQVAGGRLFGGENIYLQPLNSYISESFETLGKIWVAMVNVEDAESRFDIDEFNDLYARKKPTLYVKMADIFSLHHLIANDISSICPSQDDILRDIIRELGSAKNNESELRSVGTTEINLTLNPKLHDVEDPDAEVKSLFMETKRCILYIIRIQTGRSLLEILVKPVLDDDEAKWDALLIDEFSNGSHRKGAYSEVNTMVDLTALSYTELKQTALENVMMLEQTGRISRHNQYQDLLNDIAVDIRTKHRRRLQRQRELETVKLNLANLDDKSLWLDQQLKSYNDYIEQAMVTLQNKKGKKRFLLPFTKQYNHERELQRSGRVPKFGSFKYSARALADKGVLVAYQGYSEKQYDKINLTISSDEVGAFFVEASMGSVQIPGASALVRLDDLLTAQFDNHQFMCLFEDRMRLNVNLFLHLLFRKFYRDE
ncbi:MAG: hypothetical protein M1814_005765 [Vezdaea aestivalis]|nr:MAG: hypothetical protein M1814_005765 [Vezdaea aestivalis]